MHVFQLCFFAHPHLLLAATSSSLSHTSSASLHRLPAPLLALHVNSSPSFSILSSVGTEMCSVSDVSTRELGRAFNEIKRAGFHKVLRGQQDGSASTAAMSGAASEDEEEDVCESLIQRWGSGLKLPAPLITAAKRIAVVAKEVLKDNRDPSTTCGAALFIASQLGTMQNRRSYEGKKNKTRQDKTG